MNTTPTPAPAPTVAPAIASITGNPVVDTALKAAIMIIGSSVSTLLLAALAKYGFTNSEIITQVPALVTAILVTVATGVWAVMAKRQTVNAVVDNAILAAETGIVPEAVKAIASIQQKASIEASAAAPPTPAIPAIVKEST